MFQRLQNDKTNTLKSVWGIKFWEDQDDYENGFKQFFSAQHMFAAEAG